MVRMTDLQHSTWRRERPGLTMIVAALVVISLTTMMFYRYQADAHNDKVRAQATGLTRVLAELPMSQLVPETSRNNIIKALYLGQSQTDFAFATVRDLDGTTVAEVAAPGVIVPAAIPVSARNWLEQRRVKLGDGRDVFEVRAPLFENGDQVGSVTLAMFFSQAVPTLAQLPFFASLAFVIFLLAPIAYFAMQREIRPMREATEKMGQILSESSTAVLQPSGELSDFMSQFSGFMQQAQSRIATLEKDNTAMLTSTKLISYRKARVESVLESMPEALLVLDESGTISFANARIQALFGVNPQELQGAADLSWCPDAQVCQFLSRCAQRGPGGYVANAVQFSVDAMPGKTFAVSAYPLFSPGEASNTFGTLVVFRDVTIEVLARRSRGEFVAHVAHELKTPLNVLGMYSEHLLDSGGDDEAQRIESINVIRDEVERLASLVRNLLNLTQIEMGSLQPSLNRSRVYDLLNDVFCQLRDGHADHQVSFESELPPDLGALAIDKDLMRVAITNLLTNAIKYNRPGGTVRLTAEETDDSLLIRVSDDGIGISEADQAQIFDKFYRSEDDEVRKRSGHGLGLSLTRDIIQLHGGELSVSSTPGAGSVFEIVLWKESVRKAG